MGIVDWANVQRLKAGLLFPDERTIRDAFANLPAYVRKWEQLRAAANGLRAKMPNDRWLDLDDAVETARIQLARLNSIGLSAKQAARDAGALEGLEAWDGVVLAVSLAVAGVILAFLSMPVAAVLAIVGAVVAAIGFASEKTGNAISEFGGAAGDTIKSVASSMVWLGMIALAGYALSRKRKGW